MLSLFFIMILFLLPSDFFAMEQAIIVFGPSCSGKSTLSKRIARNLGSEWRVVDRDDLIEEGRLGDYDLVGFADYINMQTKRSPLVIDTNLYTEDFFETLKLDCKLRVLVYAPFSKLLERDELRNQRLQRSPERAQRARFFVVNNYNYFFNTANKGFQIESKEDHKDVYASYAFDVLAHSDSEESSLVTIEAIKKLLVK